MSCLGRSSLIRSVRWQLFKKGSWSRSAVISLAFLTVSSNFRRLPTKGSLEATNGELKATKGDLDATKGSLEATNGELKATKGDLDATKGSLEATNGQLKGTF
ncbi:TPA: hypothetical protein ACH3X1_000482 [Trebouxia sp. C0004]